MTNLVSNRERALKVYLSKADKTVPMLLDYQIDDFLRGMLGLPHRPKGHDPYSGWLTLVSNTPPTNYRTSQEGIDLIKRWEGCRLKAYRCPAGVWTIGYGHTHSAMDGLCITYDRAEELLKQDLQRFEKAITTLVRIPLTQNHFDALTSFVYNVGIEAFRNSTLLKLLNQKNYLLAADQFDRWTKVGKKTLPGLVGRRKEEKQLFLS
jgi:lysozyme